MSSDIGRIRAGTARAAREHRGAARQVVAALGGRKVKAVDDGLLVEFLRCSLRKQNGDPNSLMVERNAEVPEAKRIVLFGVILGDV